MEPREEKDVWAHRKLVAVDPGHIYLENLTWITDGDTLGLSLYPPGSPAGAPITRYVMKRVK